MDDGVITIATDVLISGCRDSIIKGNFANSWVGA